MTAAATAALDALRRWAATNRADLVAAAWHAGNTNVTELASAAGCSRPSIYADLKSRGIDYTTDRLEPPTVSIDEQTKYVFFELPVPGWRHPNLIKIERKRNGFGIEYRLTVKAFTGTEKRPEIPEAWNTKRDEEPNWDMCSQRTEEIHAVEKEWAKAHFTHQIGELLRRPRGFNYDSTPAVDFWDAYVAARNELTCAYAALTTTEDNRWRAALLKIVDAKAPAEKAAKAWDKIAAMFAEQDQWLLREVGEENHPSHAIRTAAATHNVDVTDWLISFHSDYERGDWYSDPPACAEIKKIIETGDARARAVDALARPAAEDEPANAW